MTTTEIIQAFVDYNAIPEKDMRTYATYRYELGWARVREIRETIRRMDAAFDALLEGKLISGGQGEDRIYEIDGERIIAKEINGELHVEVYDG